MHTNPHPQTRKWPRLTLEKAAITTACLFVIAPILLSSIDLYKWAESPQGLNLPSHLALIVPFALDAAAAYCILITIIAAKRGESAGIAHLLIWIFAGMSAYANYQRGHELKTQDGIDVEGAVWFFPAMSLTGALLLEVGIQKIRTWVLADRGNTETPLPKFRGLRWIVNPKETFTAWRAAILHGYTTPAQAINHARKGNTQPATTTATATRLPQPPPPDGGTPATNNPQQTHTIHLQPVTPVHTLPTARPVPQLTPTTGRNRIDYTSLLNQVTLLWDAEPNKTGRTIPSYGWLREKAGIKSYSVSKTIRDLLYEEESCEQPKQQQDTQEETLRTLKGTPTGHPQEQLWDTHRIGAVS